MVKDHDAFGDHKVGDGHTQIILFGARNRRLNKVHILVAHKPDCATREDRLIGLVREGLVGTHELLQIVERVRSGWAGFHLAAAVA
ncbi:MAG: hypothetical protein BWY82_00348 [Verrucomicrobia bacterium ADurb.Bin474]|nr:MAG: hypothetical protein BWY82_00348 [Verrucomicrobia bacterium ADurb.Bin474]